MALPLIPIILGVAAAGTGIAGICKGGKAIADNSKANDVNERARRLQEYITKRLREARDKSKKQLERLGAKKLHVCEVTVGKFVTLFEMIKNIELGESEGMDELGKFKIDRQSFAELKEISILAGSFAKGTLGGAVAGGAVAFGAYSAAGAFAAASTGTAIAGLSGAAATNATLAFFGGGALAAGGLGVAGGMAILGGVVAGPALLVLGAVMGSKASENLDNAYSNLAKVQEAEAEVNVLVTACNGIANRADLFTRALVRLDLLVIPQIDALAKTIKTEGADYAKYSAPARKGVAMLLSTMKAIKAILDTPLLTDKGALTEESKIVLDAVNATLVDSTAKTKKDFPQEEID